MLPKLVGNRRVTNTILVGTTRVPKPTVFAAIQPGAPIAPCPHHLVGRGDGGHERPPHSGSAGPRRCVPAPDAGKFAFLGKSAEVFDTGRWDRRDRGCYDRGAPW